LIYNLTTIIIIKYMTAGDKKFRSKVLSTLRGLKFDNVNKLTIPIYDKDKIVAKLRLITSNFTNEEVRLLAEWREANAEWFPTKFKVTKKGTRKWLEEQVIGAKDRILFWIQTLNGSLIGHLGLYRFDSKQHSCEIDNVVRGKQNIMPGIMTLASKALLNWSFSNLGLKTITLRVFSDNERAIALYERCGFKKVRDIPLKKVIKGDTIRWVEISNKPEKKVERYFSQYQITKLKNSKVNKI